MSDDKIKEQLSALMDDELDDLEHPLLLGRLQRDDKLRADLGRYELIGEVMRNGADQISETSIAARVSEALEKETIIDNVPTYPSDAVAETSSASFWKPMTGFALAASAAVVLVMSMQNFDNGSDKPVLTADILKKPEAAAVSSLMASDEPLWDRIEPRVDRRLSGYLVNHNEYAAGNGMSRAIPYVRVVGFEGDR
ncbi:MAG: sigma-E factor negative regulatory protein [Gammaproteobacteria bacterium]